MHLPASGAWGLNPVKVPVGVPATKLHLIYVGENGEAIPGPANLAALELVLGDPEEEERVKPGAEEDAQSPLAIAEETQVRQDLARTDLELLTISRLQGFLGTSLNQFQRLQESSVKNAEAQVDVTLKNLEKMLAQGGKMLEAQYESAKFLKDHLANLKPPEPPPPPTDMGAVMMGIAEVVRDCFVTMQGGAPALAALPGLRSAEGRGRMTPAGALPGSTPEIRDAEPVAQDPVKRAAAYILGVADEKQLRQLSDPKRFNEFMEGFRKLMLPQEGTAATPAPDPKTTEAAPSAPMEPKQDKPSGNPLAVPSPAAEAKAPPAEPSPPVAIQPAAAGPATETEANQAAPPKPKSRPDRANQPKEAPPASPPRNEKSEARKRGKR